MWRWSGLPMIVLAGSLLATATATAARAETCTREQFRKVVDDTGAALRRLNAEARPRIDAGLKRLKEKHGWAEEDHLEKANALLSDARSEEYDTKATDLLGRLDRLAEDSQSGSLDCGKLGELESTALELQATVRVKTQYSIARLNQLTGDGARIQAPASPAPAVQPQPARREAAPQEQSAPASARKEAAAPPGGPKLPAQPKAPATGWTTSTVEDVVRPPPPAHSPASAPLPMPPMQPPTDGFSLDEIREASRGFFGTVSTGLANVIEHAFGRLGRPTAYVLGNEGGGAFIAGVRYGKGTLFTRGGRSREVHWHGPSIGYDFGASGSKTMFLVYNLADELDIFTGFSGVDGSAYLVGGVGMTVLTDGKIVMAPIRSGVGLRLGASVGYIRFTARPTWNPF